MPLADKRRLFDVEGVVHGCRTAVRHLGARGGAIVNVGSVASDRAAPLTPNDVVDALYVVERDGRRIGPTSRRTMKRSTYTRVSTSVVGRAFPLLAGGALAAGMAFKWSKGNGRT